ncbi:hypothetical protein D3C80_2080450 [compost metagenome]
MDPQIIGHIAIGTEPDCTVWLFFTAFQRVVEFHRTHFNRLMADEFFAEFFRDQMSQIFSNL